jgi:hypothetical protein
MIVPPGFLLERPDLLSSLSDILERAGAKKDTFDFEPAHRDYWRLEAACKHRPVWRGTPGATTTEGAAISGRAPAHPPSASPAPRARRRKAAGCFGRQSQHLLKKISHGFIGYEGGEMRL